MVCHYNLACFAAIFCETTDRPIRLYFRGACDRIVTSARRIASCRNLQKRGSQLLRNRHSRAHSRGRHRAPDQGSPPAHAHARLRAAPPDRARCPQGSFGVLRFRWDGTRPHVDRHPRVRVRVGLSCPRPTGRLDRLLRLSRSDPRRRGARLALLRALGADRAGHAAKLSCAPRPHHTLSSRSRITSTLIPTPSASITSIRACCGRRGPAKITPSSASLRPPPG